MQAPLLGLRLQQRQGPEVLGSERGQARPKAAEAGPGFGRMGRGARMEVELVTIRTIVSTTFFSAVISIT